MKYSAFLLILFILYPSFGLTQSQSQYLCQFAFSSNQLEEAYEFHEWIDDLVIRENLGDNKIVVLKNSNKTINDTYVIQDNNSSMGIFKPAKFEIGMPDNSITRQYNIPLYKNRYARVTRTVKDEDIVNSLVAVPVGQSYKREAAAYFFDLYFGLNKVPVTSIARIYQDGELLEGSIQKFTKNLSEKNLYELDLDTLSMIQAEDVEKLAFIDMVLGNQDRHFHNWLYTQDMRIVPIDHGAILPMERGKEYKMVWDWMKFSETHLPFSKNIQNIILKSSWEDFSIQLKTFYSIEDEALKYMKTRIKLMQNMLSQNPNISIHDMANKLIEFHKTPL